MKVPAAGKKKVFGANFDIFCVVENLSFDPIGLRYSNKSILPKEKKKSRAGKQTKDLPVEREP